MKCWLLFSDLWKMVSLSINNPVHSGVDFCEVLPPLICICHLISQAWTVHTHHVWFDFWSSCARSQMQGLLRFFDVHRDKRPSRWPSLCWHFLFSAWTRRRWQEQEEVTCAGHVSILPSSEVTSGTVSLCIHGLQASLHMDSDEKAKASDHTKRLFVCTDCPVSYCSALY